MVRGGRAKWRKTNDRKIRLMCTCVRHTNSQTLISCYRNKIDNKALLKSDRWFHKGRAFVTCKRGREEKN